MDRVDTSADASQAEMKRWKRVLAAAGVFTMAPIAGLGLFFFAFTAIPALLLVAPLLVTESRLHTGPAGRPAAHQHPAPRPHPLAHPV
jgi:hypothetical protein